MTNQAYRLKFAHVGADVFVWGKCRVVSPETISLGDSVIIDDFVFIMGGLETKIGSFVHIAAFSSMVGGGRLLMEDFSGLSGGVRIYTGNEDYLGGSLTNPTVPAPFRIPMRGEVHIGRHAIVGANSVVLPNVSIGDGAVVGACSLVTHDCEPWKVYAGTPAKPLKDRPKSRIMELEQELRSRVYDKSGTYIPRSGRDFVT